MAHAARFDSRKCLCFYPARGNLSQGTGLVNWRLQNAASQALLDSTRTTQNKLHIPFVLLSEHRGEAGEVLC